MQKMSKTDYQYATKTTEDNGVARSDGTSGKKEKGKKKNKKEDLENLKKEVEMVDETLLTFYCISPRTKNLRLTS